MHDGGNAVDASITGCLVQATVQQEMTNHTGTVTFLYYEAATGKTYQLDAGGLLVSDLAPFRPIPPGTGVYASGVGAPCACIPGFMPGLKAMHERFGTKPWAELCQPAIHWATKGHEVNSFELMVLAQSYEFFLYSESGRKHFAPNGFLPEVGQRLPKPELATALRHLADEGPDYFITGGGRMRSVLGHTFVLRDGKPWISLGTPGNVDCTMPQVLTNLLDFGMDPYAAIDAPRLLPLEDDYTLPMESRLPSDTVAGMAKLGIRIKPHPEYDWHMGSFQMSWRDDNGTLHSTTDPRRAGKAAGF